MTTGWGAQFPPDIKKICIDALKKRWQPNYKDVNDIIQKLKKRDTK